MKNFRIVLLLVIFSIAGLGFTEAQGQPPRKGPKKAVAAKRHADKVHARRAIRRTTFVIHRAHKAVKENKVYTGNLARAVAHQRFARRLYMNGKFLRAMHQSRVARRYAILALKANKGEESADLAFDKEDEAIMNDNPVSDQELQAELDKEMPGYSTKDEDFVDKEISDIDIGENE
ncbi:MAG: hypothetical protein FD123_4159 [Bacteroidetes bacterium]|nr:MAG: hypothetical protein FD123_4159 [Bacteroidota bacterium]